MPSLHRNAFPAALALLMGLGGGTISAMDTAVGTNATAMPGDEHVQVKLAMDLHGFTPGQTTLVAFIFTVDEGWHTYWPGFNETGYGISINTEAPEWIEVGEPIWPTPERHLAPGDILDHTYEGEFTVLVPMQVKDDAKPGSPTTITSSISYLVCDDVCLPGMRSIEFGGWVLDPDLPPPRAEGFYEQLRAFYDQRPKPLMDARPNARVSPEDGAVHVHIPDASSITFFPSNDCPYFADLIADGTTDSDTLTLRLGSAADIEAWRLVSGRLEVHTKDDGVSYYDLPISFPETETTPTPEQTLEHTEDSP